MKLTINVPIPGVLLMQAKVTRHGEDMIFTTSEDGRNHHLRVGLGFMNGGWRWMSTVPVNHPHRDDLDKLVNKIVYQEESYRCHLLVMGCGLLVDLSDHDMALLRDHALVGP